MKVELQPAWAPLSYIQITQTSSILGCLKFLREFPSSFYFILQFFGGSFINYVCTVNIFPVQKNGHLQGIFVDILFCKTKVSQV